MSIDDTPCSGIQTKLTQNHLAYIATISQRVVRSAVLMLQLRHTDEVALKGTHLVLVIQRRTIAAPEIEHIIQSIGFLLPLAKIRPTYHAVDAIHERFTLGTHLHERAIIVQWDSGMIE